MSLRSVVCLFTLALCATACGSTHRSPAPRGGGKPNVLVIVLDACRPDKLGCYGYGRATTPAIDEFARDPDAVLYRRHYVQGAWTKASTASLFTGTFAFQHGVLRGEVMTEEPDRPGEYLTEILADEFDTLAERLARLGYRTFGVAKSRHLMPELGFAQGFDEYYSPAEIGSDEERVTKVLDLVRRARPPFFGYLHLSGCHHPFPERRRDPEFMRRYGDGIRYDEAARQAVGVDFTDSEIKHRILDGEITLDPEDVDYLNLIYDAELRTVDRDYVAPLLGGLKRLGRYDDTVVVVTADHGEELYDHRGYAHGHALWDEVIHVPLIVKFSKGGKPPRLGREVDAVTQAIDLTPSFLALAGDGNPLGLSGTDIFAGEPRGFAFSQTKRGWALIQDGHKLIDEGAGDELYDLRADPGERRNLAAELPERAAAMHAAVAALEAHLGTGPQAPTVETELDPDAVEELRDLGYLR